MTAKEFVRKITELKPDINSFINSEYPREFIENNIREFNITEKVIKVMKEDEVLNLIENYDLKDFFVYDFHFLEKEDYYSFDDYFFFAGFDIFIIGLNKKTLEIVCYDLDNNEIFKKCASNSSNFLDALFHLKTLQTKFLLNEELISLREELSLLTAKECAELAGGQEYVSFYEYILGY
jgi:hypothetical protein